MTGPATEILYYANSWIKLVSNTIVGMTFEADRDIVLITGGSGGLGAELARAFTAMESTVVVFDVVVPDTNSENYVNDVHYYICDVSDKDAVSEVALEVQKEIGVVTVLINNAAITTGETLLQLSYAQIERTLAINLLSSFYTIKTFLPKMLEVKRGYIVTVASTLGYMSPARLSAYGASKSGLIALHESLTYELGSPTFNTTGVKTLLVCPGQIKTSLFQGVQTPHTLLAPELEPKYVASQIVKAIKLGKRGEIKLPLYGKFLPILRSAPWPLVQVTRYISGIDRGMNSFVSKIQSARETSSSLYLNTADKISSMLSLNTPEEN